MGHCLEGCGESSFIAGACVRPRAETCCALVRPRPSFYTRQDYNKIRDGAIRGPPRPFRNVSTVTDARLCNLPADEGELWFHGSQHELALFRHRRIGPRDRTAKRPEPTDSEACKSHFKLEAFSRRRTTHVIFTDEKSRPEKVPEQGGHLQDLNFAPPAFRVSIGSNETNLGEAAAPPADKRRAFALDRTSQSLFT